jgi:hypothetical protein
VVSLATSNNDARLGGDEASFSLILGGAPNPGLGAVRHTPGFIASWKATARSRDQIEASKIRATTSPRWIARVIVGVGQ